MLGKNKCRCGLNYDGPSCPLCVPTEPSPIEPSEPAKAKAPPVRLEYIQRTKVKALVKQLGKRCSNDFLLALDDVVRRKIVNASRVHNGGRKTLEAGCLRVVSK